MLTSRIHATAIVEDGVRIGERTAIWDHVHIRRGAVIGDDCIVGEKTYIAYDVRIGHRVKINAMVYVCAQVRIEDEVMIAAGTVFTNDVFPRAADHRSGQLLSSDPTEETLETVVRRGTTIGANTTIGPGITLGEYCMVGMGSVVTRSVEPFTLVLGNPARPQRRVCACGKPLGKWLDPPAPEVACGACGQGLAWEDGRLRLR